MSTVVIDEKYRQRLITNEINKSARHCRIGRVRFKMKTLVHDLGYGRIIPVGIARVTP